MKKIFIIILVIIYIVLFIIIYKFDLTSVCNSKKTYCTWFFSESMSLNLTDEEYKMYNTLDNPWISSIYWFYKLAINDSYFLFKNIIYNFSFIFLIIPYYFYY
jgi:hypothetical protein